MKRNTFDEEKKRIFIEERVKMDGENKELELESIARYRFASKWTEGKSVYDCACGVGYGVEYLKSSDYTGYDSDEKALEEAKKYGGKYKKQDLDKVRFGKVDCIVSFETMEHLEDPVKFIRKASEACDTFIFSVPNNEWPGDNPFHKWIFNENDFKDIIRKYFSKCEFWHQEHEEISETCYPSYLIGVCGR